MTTMAAATKQVSSERRMASVVGGGAGAPTARYEMFEVVELDPEGATLTGPVLLEVGETVVLALGPGGVAVRRAVVETASTTAGMKVRFRA